MPTSSVITSPLPNAVVIPRESVRPDPTQARKSFDESHIAELRESIRAHGILQPLVVRHDPSRLTGAAFRLISGERRFRASEGVLEQLPCIIEDVDAATARELSLVENLQRRDLSAAEEASVVREIMEREGLSIREVADRLHKSQGWVTNRLAYLRTGADVREVGERVVKAMSSLLLVDKVKKPEARRELLEGIERDELRHAEVKLRVDALLEAEESARKAAEFVKRSQQAPEAETQGRVAAVKRGESGTMSRGQRVTGGASRQEANQEVIRALNNLKAWVAHCDDDTHAQAVELARRIIRGDLAR